jgi:hypothetical protein
VQAALSALHSKQFVGVQASHTKVAPFPNPVAQVTAVLAAVAAASVSQPIILALFAQSTVQYSVAALYLFPFMHTVQVVATAEVQVLQLAEQAVQTPVVKKCPSLHPAKLAHLEKSVVSHVLQFATLQSFSHLLVTLFK